MILLIKIIVPHTNTTLNRIIKMDNHMEMIVKGINDLVVIVLKTNPNLTEK